LKDLVPVRIYAKLFSASYLSRKRAQIPDFANLVDFLAWERLEKGEGIVVYSLDYDLLSHLKDLVEKIGFMLLSHDILKDGRKKHRSLMKLPFEERVKTARAEWKADKFKNDKYYLYNFIIYTKASLDSIAVTLNSFFGFGFKKGQIDFGKRAFVRKLENSLKEFKNFSQIYQHWIDTIIEYRDAMIHQKSIDIFPSGKRWTRMIPMHPLSEHELRELREKYDDLKSAVQKRRISKYLNLVSLSSFMKTSIKNILTITGLLSAEILRELKTKYPHHEPSKTYYH
jgi:hypothetical protein